MSRVSALYQPCNTCGGSAASAKPQTRATSLSRVSPRQSAVPSSVRFSATPAAVSVVASGAARQSTAARSSSAAPSRATGLSRSQTFNGFGNLNYNSQIEQAVVNANTPLRFDTRDTVTANNYRGLYLNKPEADQFRGPLPIDQYKINNDSNPEVIRKPSNKVNYTQEVSVRHLRPPTPAKPGDLVIKEFQRQIPAGPPVVVRQEGARAQTPCPLIYREAPPRPPTRIPEQVVEVEGAPIPPPARKVVFEKLPDQPAKPQNIVIEKWLPYKPQKRRVVFQRSCAAPPPNPKNLIIEWQQPCVEVNQVCKDLGVCRADPEDYIRRYGCELKQAHEIPTLCQEGSCQNDASQPPALELEGDVDALRLVDLDANGLGDYRRFL